MRVLFLGGVTGNTGPANANKCFVEHWPLEDEVFLVSSGAKVKRLLSMVEGALKADVVLETGPGRLNSIANVLAKLSVRPPLT